MYYVIFTRDENNKPTCTIYRGEDPKNPDQHVLSELNVATWLDFLAKTPGGVPEEMTYQFMWPLKPHERKFIHDLIISRDKNPPITHMVSIESPSIYRGNFFWIDLCNIFSRSVANSDALRNLCNVLTVALTCRPSNEDKRAAHARIETLRQSLVKRQQALKRSQVATEALSEKLMGDPLDYLVVQEDGRAFSYFALLPAGADIIYRVATDGQNSLQQDEFLKLLAQLKAESPELFLMPEGDQSTTRLHLIMLLIQHRRLDLLKSVFNACPEIKEHINHKYHHGQTPLLVAAQRLVETNQCTEARAFYEIIEFLLQHGANALELSKFGLSPVNVIATLGHFGQAYDRTKPPVIDPVIAGLILQCLKLFAEYSPDSLTQVNFDPALDRQDQFDLLCIAHCNGIIPGYNTPSSALFWLLVSLPRQDPRLPTLQNIFNQLNSVIPKDNVMNPLVFNNVRLSDYYLAALIAYYLKNFGDFFKQQQEAGNQDILKTCQEAGALRQVAELKNTHAEIYSNLTPNQQGSLYHAKFDDPQALESFVLRWREICLDFSKDNKESDTFKKAWPILEGLKRFLKSHNTAVIPPSTAVIPPSTAVIPPSTAVIPDIFQSASVVARLVSRERITSQITAKTAFFNFVGDGDDEEDVKCDDDFIDYALSQLEGSSLTDDQLLARLKELRKTFSEQPAAAANRF